MTTAIEQAMQITALRPLPPDARAQIEALEDQMHPFEFEQIMEGLAMAEFDQGEVTDEDDLEGGPDANV